MKELILCFFKNLSNFIINTNNETSYSKAIVVVKALRIQGGSQMIKKFLALLLAFTLFALSSCWI